MFLIFSYHVIYAQECLLKGQILDETSGSPLANASVSIFNNEKGEGLVFTNIEGKFELKINCEKKYNIEIGHDGYENHSEGLDLENTKLHQFKLKKTLHTASIEEVLVKAKAVKVKGDTIEFNANSFKTGKEEVLEDILKKLPGVEVVNGKLLYKGKEMTQVTVGGREVLGGNQKLLNKNLPSDAVSKIQLNTKFKANPFASSLQEDEQFSLNIELKNNMKSLAFGNATLGGDAKKHTDAQAKVFYFSEKIDATLINDFNTYGKQVFDRDDYFNFFGGISEFTSEGSIYSIRGGNNALNFEPAVNAFEINTYNGAVHFGYEPNKKIKISGFGLANTSNIRYKSKVERVFSDIFKEEDDQDNKNNLLSVMARIRIDYFPTDKGQFKYRLNLNYVDSEEEQFVNRYRNTEFTGFSQNQTKRENYNVSQTLSYIQKTGVDNNIGFYIRHQYQKETPDLMMSSGEQMFNTWGALTPYNGRYLLSQNQDYTTNTLQIYSIYNHLINNTTNLKFKIGTNFSSQNFENKIYDQEKLITADNTVADTGFNYNETFIDATITKKFGNFQADLGAGASFFSEKSDFINGAKTNLNESKILPHAILSYKINTATQITLNYNQAYSFPNAKDLTESYVIQNYRSIFSGNINLRQALTHTSSLNFNHFNSFTFFNIFANLSYVYRERSIQNNSRFEKVFADPSNQDNYTVSQINSLFNSDYEEKTYSGMFRIGKKFTKWLNTRLSGNLAYSDYYIFTNTLNNQETQAVNSTNFTQNYTLTNQIMIKKYLELNIGLNTIFNKFQSLTKQNFDTWRPFADIAWTINKKFLLQTDFSYRIQNRDGERINEAKDLNASLRYNIAKNVYITLVGGNLLGNGAVVNNSFNDIYIETITKNVLGRYFMVNVRYKF
ncbi:carboxypeptidase-like regulatory domain-containing protein [Chryseobacterium sp. CFBP8996]|uniref:carboxypeptidase-like regulatory domain-containing protein n=1 Tax=Chryseobacterium sp. CFBP8996 TaxID=3096529 RepID=UPI002A6B76B8|nr:carboxypeptidase-like regulatory domain-containing protein [Chryseobacterium sp. CFBP8996]MDY0930811.1 carboxypeptidase-like regulatory domain-containing protein [Chryseobacterium sp. CFBP8996]